ncbi:putative amino acid permease 7, partial [Zea mays]
MGQPPHRLRLLRALLAHRPRQPRHRSPPPRRLPGVHAAGVRVRGPQVRRRGHGRRGAAAAGAGRAPRERERVQAVLPHGVRGGDHGAGRLVPLLQPDHRAARLLHLLAARRLLPRRDVPHEEQGGAVDQPVARHPCVQPRLPAHQRVRLRRLCGWRVRVGDELIQTLQMQLPATFR